MASSSKDPYYKPCIIVGAGVAGLLQAAELLRKNVLAHDDILILERADGVGGVWKQATYPGAACDVFSILYQISWFRNPNWSSLFPSRNELVAYYTSFAQQYRLFDITLFDQTVIRATWDESSCLWIVVAIDSLGKETTWTCSILVQSTGTYNRPKYPNIRGIPTFQGDSWHTADWPAKYDFHGKKVAYIGTGPTALQILPVIQPRVKQLTVYMRSMTYCHPFGDFRYPKWLLWMFAHIPGLMAMYACLLAWGFGTWTWFVFRPGSWLAKREEKYCRKYLEEAVEDVDLRAKLSPEGRFGSKRPLVSKGFFKVVQKENVNVVSEELVKVDEEGIVSKTRQLDGKSSDGEPAWETHRAFDTIIWGTGFKMQGWGSMIPTAGLGGKLLSEKWADSPESLYGVMTHGFPNLMIINGPNTVAPWASIIRGMEHQVAYSTKLIRMILERSRSSNSGRCCLMPTREAEHDWTEAMQGPLETLATSTKFGPGYYYLSASGRNTFFFPFRLGYYARKTRKVDKEEYVVWSGKSEV